MFFYNYFTRLLRDRAMVNKIIETFDFDNEQNDWQIKERSSSIWNSRCQRFEFSSNKMKMTFSFDSDCDLKIKEPFQVVIPANRAKKLFNRLNTIVNDDGLSLADDYISDVVRRIKKTTFIFDLLSGKYPFHMTVDETNIITLRRELHSISGKAFIVADSSNYSSSKTIYFTDAKSGVAFRLAK